MIICIHAIPEREQNVSKLKKELERQGIRPESIVILYDNEKKGNLQATLSRYEWLSKNCPDPTENVWHLQDDVVLAEDFVQRISTLHRLMFPFIHFPVVCGICTKYDVDENQRVYLSGPVRADQMWYSFPCIMLPVAVTNAFLDWYEHAEKTKQQKELIKVGKGDDSLFRDFMVQGFGKQCAVYNYSPNLVDHRDDLVGGSVVNPQRNEEIRALFFDERREYNAEDGHERRAEEK